MPIGAAQRRQKSARRCARASHRTRWRGDRGRDRKGGIDRREPVGLDAGMQRVPDEIQRDGPEHRVDQHARRQRAGIAPGQRVKPHRAEDPDQRRCECDLGRNQFGDEGGAEILDPGAADLLDEGDPVVIGIPEDDRREYRQRDQAAEIGPWRDQPAPQFRDDRPARSGSPGRKTARCISTTAPRRPRRRPRATTRRARSPAPWREKTARSSRPPAAAQSGVTIRVPTAAISVTLSRMVAVAATRWPPNRIAAARYTAQLIGSASRIDTSRTPSSVSPAIMVPSADHQRDHRRMIVIAAGEMLRPHPVIGFVEGQRRQGGGDQPQRHQRQDRQDRVADEPRIAAGSSAASSLAPDEQSGHRVIPHHAHQRAGRARQPPDRLLIVDRERHADIGGRPTPQTR